MPGNRPDQSGWTTPEQAAEYLRTGDGEGVKIAIIDSGVDVSHPALKGLQLADDVAVLRYISRFRVVEGTAKDAFGHGTAIAGIIRRIAPKAEIGSFRVLGEGLTSRSDLVAEGVRQAIYRGYHIINCSFGCRGDQNFIMSYKAWVDEAYLNGTHVIAACNNQDFSIPEWPGHFSTVITVNFTDCEEEEFFHVPGSLVGFRAKGSDVEVPWIGGGKKTVVGSSYAAPHVSGLVARILSKAPNLSPLLMKDLLHRIAKPEKDLPW